MMRKLEKLFEITGYIKKNHVGAFAAQAAYFLMLSMIPIFLLLLTIVQVTPVTKTDVLLALTRMFPEEHMQSFLVNIINQVYSQSQAMIPVTALAALWSAGKGVLAINAGLNCVYNTRDTRNFFIVRIRASFYTVIFILVIVLGLTVSVFGNNLSLLISQYFPFLRGIIVIVLESRTIASFLIWFCFALVVYRFLPERRYKLRNHVPGAVFTSVVWMVISFGFSAYLTFFKGFAGLYGSMTAIVLVMLWLYFCMYAMLVGGLINSRMVAKWQ